MSPRYAIVTDFDGTVTTQDIGNCLAIHNGTVTPESLEEDFRAQKGANEWMRHHFGLMKTCREDFESLALSYAEVKPGFNELAAYCRANNIPLEIASGGLDIYISPVLKKYNLQHVPVLSARGTFTGGTIRVDHPDFDGMSLHDFKASRVRRYKEEGYKVIFMGDGPSDFEAAKLADIVFATSYLEKLCKTNNVKYYELKDFRAALEILKENNVTVH